MKGECFFPAQVKMGDILTMRERDREQEIPEPRQNKHAEKSQMRWGNQRKRKRVPKSKQEIDSGGKTPALHVCAHTRVSSICLSAVCSKNNQRKRTCGICEPEGHRLIFDVTNISDRDLARVISKVLGSEVFQLQHLGLTLDGTKHMRHNIMLKYYIFYLFLPHNLNINLIQPHFCCITHRLRPIRQLRAFYSSLFYSSLF